MESKISKIDTAMKTPLPEGIEIQRGLGSLDHLTGYNGIPKNLVGSTQKEPGYTSGSLGKTPAFSDHPYRIEINTPKGSNGIWVGKKSAFPNQREFILPRSTEYRITSAEQDPTTGKWILKAEVLP